MAFILENFGSEVANAKGTLGGICYYRYFNENGDTLTNSGYFPANLGLNVGDRIRVIPKTNTDADEIYIVTSIANREVTVKQVNTAGAVDSVNGKTGAVVLDASDVGALPDTTPIPDEIQYETIPEASATNEGQIVQYIGATNATYTNGYFYKCAGTITYTDSTTFNPASISGTTVTATAGALAGLCAEYGSGNITDIIKGTLTYDQSGGLLVFVGLDDTDTQVCTFQLYTQDYEDAGFTFTGTLQDGDVINFTTTISESTSYAWTRVDVQPTPDPLPSQSGQNGKFLTTNGTTASWGTVESLPSQTGQSGKFLTTDGTDASWGTINALQNKATGYDALSILGSATPSYGAINIGASSNSMNGNSGVAIGISAVCSGSEAVAIGRAANVSALGCVAIGHFAKATANQAIQLGASSSYNTNSDANTFKVANDNGNFEIMSADGTVPAARHAALPATDGTYVLKLVIASGVPTLSWVAE